MHLRLQRLPQQRRLQLLLQQHPLRLRPSHEIN
jgi:hypothetical protein